MPISNKTTNSNKKKIVTSIDITKNIQPDYLVSLCKVIYSKPKDFGINIILLYFNLFQLK